MDRRNFLGSMGLLGAAAFLPGTAFSMSAKARFKMGLQLYTIHNDMEMDTRGTLKTVKASGFEDFEVFGFDAEKGTIYGQKPSEFKKLLEDLQLTASSGHFGFAPHLGGTDAEMTRFVDQCIKAAKAMDLKYITWPTLAPEQRNLENFMLLAHKLNGIGEQITSAGLGFAFHNNGFEFQKHAGTTLYELILKETDPQLVKLQLDMYWAIHSGIPPKELVKKQPGRFVMWHIKDMDKITRDYTELGNGSINYPDILPDPKESGLEFYYLEQGGNFAHSPMQSVAQSAAYFKKNLQRYL